MLVPLFFTLVFAYISVAEEAPPESSDNEPSTETLTEESEDSPEVKEEEEREKSIVAITEDSNRIEGLLTLFRDRKTDEVRLPLDKEFLYFSYTENGPAAAGFFRRGLIAGKSALINLGG